MAFTHLRLRSVELLASAACIAAFTGVANADTVSINRSNQGWYSEIGYHSATNLNTFTGKDTSTMFGTAPLGVYQFHSFFVFNLGGVSGNATGAAINFYCADFYNVFQSSSFTIYDVTTPATTLVASHTTGEEAGGATYSDLGSGNSYGGFTVQSFYSHQSFHVLLDAAALADINASRGGLFAIGVSLTGGYRTPNGPEGVNFGMGNNPQAQLVVGTDGSDISGLLLNPRIVPLPTAWGMAVVGLLACMARRVRR